MSKIHRENNFDFLRIILASFVIISHSYLCAGNKTNEIMLKLTNGQEGLGGFAVKCFFIISGYLIYLSLSRSKNLNSYFWNRFLRLYPAYIVMLLVICLIVPFVYLGEEQLIENISYRTYFFRQLSFYHIQDSIDGVFTDLPSNIVNGSLWTICYEVSMYILISFLFFINKKFRIYYLILSILASYIIITFYPFFLNNFLFKKIYLKAPQFYELFCFFFAGALMTYVNIKKVKIKNLLIVLAFLLIIISYYYNFFSYVKYLILPIFVILIGTQSTPYLNQIGIKLGDNSYGIYIYGWFIQQLLMYYFNLTTFPLMILSLIISYIVGLLSWHLIEKKALVYKNLFTKKTLL